MTWMQHPLPSSETDDKAPSSESAAWSLLALTPQYQEDEHGPYVVAIRTALGDKNVRNIALSGNYGVGKSSILQQVSTLEGERVVELSLSTLAPIALHLDESVPAQAATPTNRIQQEIVKQLLYRETPSRAPGSRFRRIERFRWPREIAFAAVSGFVIAALFMLVGWGATVATTLKPVLDLGLGVYILIFCFAAATVLTFRCLFHGRIHIKEFSAGQASVTLDENSVSYFDQYLDEIVYFFETSREVDVVIFEDIDRFNDSHIFETLRALNTLLNASPQLGDRSIRFIYAIKDSIFDRIGLAVEGRDNATPADLNDPAQIESLHANRTKFFDLVIPVVPFITHRSARNLASRLLADVENTVKPDVVDLASRYVPDMRLLKNVRNEFVVFRDRVFSGDGDGLALSDTDLFAMMLYKSTHMTDFERIRLGNSQLDKLYSAQRKLVADNIRRLEQEVRTAQGELSRDQAMPRRAVQLGQRLRDHIARTVRAIGYTSPAQYETYLIGRTQFTSEDLKSVPFWEQLVSSGSNVVWSNTYTGHSLTFAASDLAESLDETFDSALWAAGDTDELNGAITSALADIQFLRQADISETMTRPDLVVSFEGKKQSMEAVAESLLLTKGLAFQLVRAGYLNRNFTLYTSTFHGDRLSAAATNYLIHHIERSIPDVHFQLDGDDVDAILRERGSGALEDPALYNISLLDHLLRTDVERADRMVGTLAPLGPAQAEFVQAYLDGGAKAEDLVAMLAPRCPKILFYLTTDAELSNVSRARFVSRALTNLRSGRKYELGQDVTAFLKDHWQDLPVLTDVGVSSGTAVSIALYFGAAGVKISDLEMLTALLRKEFVARGVYQLTTKNLKVALGEDADLALDAIMSNNAHVFEYAVENLGNYVQAIDGHSDSIRTDEGFAIVVGTVNVAHPDLLESIVERASEDSWVEDVDDVPEDTWPTLAKLGRFATTFSNVTKYIESVGALDENLAILLKQEMSITDHEAASEEAKAKLALTILAARSLIHSSKRVPLAASLGLSALLDASAIATENGPLFALLVEAGLVADEADTYRHIAHIKWEWREELIAASDEFVEYVTPGLLGGDLSGFLTSQKIAPRVKRAVFNDTMGYAQAADASGRRVLGHFAASEGVAVPIEFVELLAAERAEQETVIQLLRPHLDSLSDTRLFAILNAVGGPYTQLTVVGRDKPRVENTDANQALLKTLERRGIVGKYDPHGQPIVVNKKHGSRS